MLAVEPLLLPASARGLVHGHPHGWRDGIGIQDHPSLRVAGSPADGLDKRSLRSEESLLVRIENRHQGNFRDIQPLPEEIDAHQHVERSLAEVTDDLHPFHGVDIGMQVADPHLVLVKILRQVLRHPLGQRGHQYPAALACALPDLGQQVVHLADDRPHLHFRVQQSGGAHHLLHHLRRMPSLVWARRGGDEDHLTDHALELIETQRAVIQRRRQPEPVFHQGFLA